MDPLNWLEERSSWTSETISSQIPAGMSPEKPLWNKRSRWSCRQLRSSDGSGPEGCLPELFFSSRGKINKLRRDDGLGPPCSFPLYRFSNHRQSPSLPFLLAMTSLSVSAPLKPSSFLPSRSIPKKALKPPTLLYKSSLPTVRALVSSSSPPTKSSSLGRTVGLGLGIEETQGYSSSHGSTLYASSPCFSAPQTLAMAMKGAETDMMGLLLRERIVFLRSSINDFMADTIISQLLLLDAQDPTKDIRLFINSPGGSLRFERYASKLSNYGED